jgi:hypothetical protein
MILNEEAAQRKAVNLKEKERERETSTSSKQKVRSC